MYGIKPEVNKEYILKNVSQEEIFEHFLQIPVRYNTLFRSPLRNDHIPTCTFKYLGDRLNYRDWADHKSKDCFNIVMEVRNCDYNEALNLINKELIDAFPRRNTNSNDSSIFNGSGSGSHIVNQRNKQSKKIINVSLAKYFQPVALEYLKQYGITYKQTTKFNIFPIEHMFLNGQKMWSYSNNDPAIGYYFGKDDFGNQRWKIYFFNRSNYRFIGNTNRINGWIQIPDKGNLLVITKSLKDVACLDLFNIDAIAMQNETTIPYDYIIDELKSRFKNIISLYDFDKTGVTNANKLKKLYNIPYLFFKDVPSVKDFSDYIKVHGKQKTQQLIDNTYEYLEKTKIIL